ncbi:MAG: hypothetical protein CVV41_13760 [Candidatus Riflebacteria bacterium HGW-Riflebacteria-1]|jgi:hypothetical protein|nr:MAG: hypothetical protein CVV41_13760 [Candidatus Riflebacteria bacterium HGW-Riflebacteria-1]
MNASFLATTVPLCKVKVRLLLNSLKARVTAKKAVLILFGALAVIFSVAMGVSELVMFMNITGPNLRLAEWLIGFIACYAAFMVFACDLLSGHTINAGQMSSDFDYLSTLPVSPTSLLCVKIFERFASDYIGAMILLTGFIAATCRNGINISGILISILLFTQISMLIGTIINLIMLTLRRYLPLTSINNFFSFFGYVVGFAVLIPYAIVDHMPNTALEFFVNTHNRFHDSLFVVLQPIRWLGTILIKAEPVTELLKLSGIWLIAMLACGLFLLRALNSGALSIRKTKTNRKDTKKAGRFSGLVQKDYLLLKSDYNIRINSILLPVTFIVLNSLFFSEAFELKTSGAMLYMMYSGIIYFCMFGPTNTIGSEGRAISLLESLPLHPEMILRRKFVFWFSTAALIFLPLSVAQAWYLNFDLLTTTQVALLTLLFTAACVWAALQISAIFPVFDSKMLQQSSTISAKVAVFGTTLALIPFNELTALNLYSLLIFAIAVVLLNMKARALMYYRLESTQHNNRQQQWFNFILLVCGFLGFEAFINKIFQALIPGENTGLWAWVVPALVILPILMISAVSRKPWAHESANSVDKKPGYLKTAAAAAVISALSAGGTWLYLAYSHGKRDFLSSELIDFTRLISGLGVSSWLAEMLTIALPVAVAGFFTLLAALLASKDLADRQYQKAFVTLAALAAIAPASVTVPTLVTIALIAMHCRHFQSAVAAALVAALSTALPLIFFCR